MKLVDIIRLYRDEEIKIAFSIRIYKDDVGRSYYVPVVWLGKHGAKLGKGSYHSYELAEKQSRIAAIEMYNSFGNFISGLEK